MLRRAFLRRMAFAALATWFLDLPLPVEGEPLAGRRVDIERRVDGGEWEPVAMGAMLNADGTITMDENTRAWYDADGRFHMIRRTA